MPQTLYDAEGTAVGGRMGRVATADGRVDVGLQMPGMGPDDGSSTNPEALFALGYSACFLSAMQITAKQQGIEIDADSAIKATVALQHENHVYGLAVTLEGKVPSLDGAATLDLMRAAHEVCPYSRAVAGNVEVELKAAE